MLDTLVEVKGKLCITEDAFLLGEELSQTIDDFLLRLHFANCIRLCLFMKLKLPLEVLNETSLLLTQHLDLFKLFIEVFTILLLELVFLLVKLLLHVLVCKLLFCAELGLYLFLLAFLHLDISDIRHKLLGQPLDLPIEVDIFHQVLWLRHPRALALRSLSQKAHGYRVR